MLRKGERKGKYIKGVNYDYRKQLYDYNMQEIKCKQGIIGLDKGLNARFELSIG